MKREEEKNCIKKNDIFFLYLCQENQKPSKGNPKLCVKQIAYAPRVFDFHDHGLLWIKNNNQKQLFGKMLSTNYYKNPAYRKHWISQCVRIVTPIAKIFFLNEQKKHKKWRRKKVMSQVSVSHVTCQVLCFTCHLSPVTNASSHSHRSSSW